MSNDPFKHITKEYQSKLSAIFAKYDKLTEPLSEQIVRTQPMAIEDMPALKVAVERWTVYSFTLPVKYTKKIAFGFASKDEAEDYIARKLLKKDEDGNIIRKSIKEDDKEYIVHYSTILDSIEQVDVYYNDPKITTVGNELETVLKEFLS